MLPCAAVPKGFQDIRITFKIKAAAEDMDTLMELAKFSPVYNTITQSANVDIQINPQ
jgi:uncharacterized OsmC-like protein